MERKDEKEVSFSRLKFPLLPLPPDTVHSGTATPPLHTLASVPFKWEEQPGKPRPCTDIIALPEPEPALDLPPCRMTKLPSPTAVLDGPYNLDLARPKFSSFRFFREPRADGGSFGFSPSSKTTMRRNGSSFSSLAQAAAPTHHHLWGSIYESLKQAVAWKSTRKSKKERIRIKEYEIIY
ncbi:hypothetical protein MIMGU_mgv1a021126mg [Erythranthe guttata]|uniref:Uncharacterized protein n=1 Tax=Erythranthe guttata TaxID=4155 RepID=A0A022RF91_ERYGU|nr:hypothetical protein MIMGU_mgv1a021126mg [Erythranthe guttata]